ncbi:YolD-like family protein [Bacillus atrophaeus]|nr:YolD-like family protein [Bacillus atrophaeus]MCY8842540.1 YolD-like family protein [Bacillus atrophaeus]
MSLNKELKFQLYEDGYVKELIGRVQYLNYEQKKLHVKDQNDLKIYITINDIIGVEYID